MMVCNGDTVSGAKKREAKSEAYQANPFNYSFYPIPVTDKGGYFIDSPSLEFSVNKDCENLDMTNEFMRFLLRTKELQNMASLKGLIPSTKSTSFDAVYAPFGKVPSDRTISPEVIGVKDQLATQIRLAAYKVGKGELTIDEAVAQYGSLE
jgi:multiple sugar transport system substrate-binding protein